MPNGNEVARPSSSMAQPNASVMARKPPVQAAPRLRKAWVALARKNVTTVAMLRAVRPSSPTRTQAICPRIVAAAKPHGR